MKNDRNFWRFFLAGIPLSFITVIGLVSLVGIVVNNAIIMVETINLHRNQGVSVREAPENSASERLQPILQTTIITVADLTPLAMKQPVVVPFGNGHHIWSCCFTPCFLGPGAHHLFFDQQETSAGFT
jgi:multidrug efflux pump subunit AcrB